MQLPSDFKQKLYVHLSTDTHDKGRVKIFADDLSQYGSYVCVGIIDAEFDLSAFSDDVTDKHIESLEAQKVKILAEAHQKVKNIDEQIQSLQAIESK